MHFTHSSASNPHTHEANHLTQYKKNNTITIHSQYQPQDTIHNNHQRTQPNRKRRRMLTRNIRPRCPIIPQPLPLLRIHRKPHLPTPQKPQTMPKSQTNNNGHHKENPDKIHQNTTRTQQPPEKPITNNPHLTQKAQLQRRTKLHTHNNRHNAQTSQPTTPHRPQHRSLKTSNTPTSNNTRRKSSTKSSRPTSTRRPKHNPFQFPKRKSTNPITHTHQHQPTNNTLRRQSTRQSQQSLNKTHKVTTNTTRHQTTIPQNAKNSRPRLPHRTQRHSNQNNKLQPQKMPNNNNRNPNHTQFINTHTNPTRPRKPQQPTPPTHHQSQQLKQNRPNSDQPYRPQTPITRRQHTTPYSTNNKVQAHPTISSPPKIPNP